MEIETLARDNGETIAYHRRIGTPPSIVWFGGFKSDMTGLKAQALDRWAAENGRDFIRFDYFGHGASSGDFRKGTITRWHNDGLAVLERIAQEPVILVGSSMGGWLALLAALKLPTRVKALLLIAPAVDFTRFMWDALPEDVRMQIEVEGEWQRPSAYDSEPYPITRQLIEDGRRHLVLDSPISLSCPVRILHGMKDPDIPWIHSVRLIEALTGDATLTLVRDGDHRLSMPGDLRLLTGLLQTLLDDLAG